MKSERLVSHGAAEQLVDLGVARDAGVVATTACSRPAWRCGDLGADLAGGAGFGFDHHRLLESAPSSSQRRVTMSLMPPGETH